MSHVRIHTLKRADELTEKDMGRCIVIGNIDGELASLMPVSGHIHIGLIVAGDRAWFTLLPDVHVDVWGKPRGATR